MTTPPVTDPLHKLTGHYEVTALKAPHLRCLSDAADVYNLPKYPSDHDGLSPSLFWSKDTSQDQQTVTAASGEDPNAFAMRVLRDSDTGITSGRERPDRAFHGPIPAA
jgi:hypothetical protein